MKKAAISGGGDFGTRRHKLRYAHFGTKCPKVRPAPLRLLSPQSHSTLRGPHIQTLFVGVRVVDVVIAQDVLVLGCERINRPVHLVHGVLLLGA